MKLIEILPDKCTGCEFCVVACTFRHTAECGRTASRIKVLKGKEWAFDFPILCTQCSEAPCIDSCPTGALVRDQASGIVVLDHEKCNNCQACVFVCPVQALTSDHDKNTVFKCDLCGGDPECVKWCTREALTLKDAELDSPTRQDYISRASRLMQT